jgi:4-hydroxy-2-oxoheptanedioate aldolase
MRTNHVKTALRQGHASCGGWLALPSIPVARFMARLGFQWLAIDMEHGALDVPTMAQMVAAVAETGTCAPLVRVPDQQAAWIKWALDAGAWGIIVPMVGTRADAEQVVRLTRYPPAGIRSFGGAFAHHTFAATRAAYGAAANDEILLVVQIESTTALANLDDILSVPGIDAALVGPYDLRVQLGLQPASDGNEPAFVQALTHIQAAAQHHSVPLGIYCSDGHVAARRINEGYLLVSVISDTGVLTTGAQHHLMLADETGSATNGAE